MDTNEVYQLFSATYHSDPNIQKQAEGRLRQVQFQVNLLWIVIK